MNKYTSSGMIQIKKTKSVEMLGDESVVIIKMATLGSIEGTSKPLTIMIPIKNVFQVKRGLESYIQKFYRKQIKK